MKRSPANVVESLFGVLDATPIVGESTDVASAAAQAWIDAQATKAIQP